MEATNLHPYTAPLELFLDFFNERPIPGGTPPDIIDSSIRTKKTVDEVQREASALSKQWGVVTTLTPDDFVAALEPVLDDGKSLDPRARREFLHDPRVQDPRRLTGKHRR